ncbi:MAG TPA: NAD(P)/FAD-dependent oxidoreductase [Gemmatimonadales bacterium]|jgi:phytoene dehydrogenase-like protein
MSPRRSAIVVGSGPNGLAAAITLAQAGYAVTVFEAEATIGGGTRSAALTLPGFVHDVCSAIHPMAVASPFFRSLPLADRGLEWVHSPAPLAHPFDDGTAVMLERSIEATSGGLGADARRYRDLFAPLVDRYEPLIEALLGPLIPPQRPLMMARFGVTALRSAEGLAMSRFAGERARALFAGIAAHAVLPLEAPGSASFALVLGMVGHAVGWPFPRGGSQKIGDALAASLAAAGGAIVTNRRVVSPPDVATADAVIFDLSPRQLIAIAGDRLPPGYRRRMAGYRYGPAAFKIDWALSGPIPWRAAECARAATVHLGGALAEITASERAAPAGEHAQRPFVLLAQPSLFDPTRAPVGSHTAWAYCHVPNGSSFDMTARIEAQVERFAPGFRDLVIGRHVTGPAEFERYNGNYVGGDVVGGSNDLIQMLGRPIVGLHPYRIPVRGWFLGSASTPPGGGVHGMAGFHAANAALRSIGGGR